jgi:hypothetical protein
MPWWGWLIAFGIVCTSLTLIMIVVLMTRTMKSLNESFEQRSVLPRSFRRMR